MRKRIASIQLAWSTERDSQGTLQFDTYCKSGSSQTFPVRQHQEIMFDTYGKSSSSQTNCATKLFCCPFDTCSKSSSSQTRIYVLVVTREV